ncbi:MAG: DUF4197 domain-containing protein [Bacteroidales bacterium]|jgi:hypothetical protein|nr:DUF4197 domain-containing protein [Bacteroidales bacterium]
MKKLLVAAFILSLASCDESGLPALTENEVIDGLKEALITGATNSSAILSAENGYFADAAVKILLPEEAGVIIDNISMIPGIDKLVDDVILSINRAAEDAAREIVPVFAGSIKQMTVTDGFNILNGADNAATSYLKNTTYNELYSLYKPKIEASTQKAIIGNVSAADSWDTMVGKWNILAKLANLKPVNTDLNDYLTTKALDGVFIKVESEEFKIRKDAKARVTPLLQRVFGSIERPE